MTTGARLIREARETAGLTQEELAEHLGEVRPTVTRWETGRTQPSIAQINALAAILPVTVDRLLRAYGANLVVTTAGRVPRAILDDLSQLDAESLQIVGRVVRALRQHDDRPEGQPLR